MMIDETQALATTTHIDHPPAPPDGVTHRGGDEYVNGASACVESKVYPPEALKRGSSAPLGLAW